MKNILFVCTGNSCRSVMAEGLFKSMIAGREDEFSVSSAGVGAVDGFPASIPTIRVMQEEGIDVSQHESRRLTAEMVDAADKIYVMEKMHRDAILMSWPEARGKVLFLTAFSTDPARQTAEIDIPDPIQMPDNFYRSVLSIIRDCVKRIVEES